MDKPLSKMNLDDLKEVFEFFGIDLPSESPTRNELLTELKRLDITNKKIQEYYGKQENKLDVDEYKDSDSQVANDGDVVVAMTRKNAVFVWKDYHFGGKYRFLPMPKSDALELIQAYDGFHIATREEIKRYYS